MKKTIGMDVPTPQKVNSDKKCPFFGDVTVKKETITGTVIKKDIHNSAVMEWESLRYVRKYERYEKRRSRVHVHNSLNAQIGDIVLAAKTRPLSKTKHYAIIKILKRAKE